MSPYSKIRFKAWQFCFINWSDNVYHNVSDVQSFFKWANPGLFFILFLFFQTHITIFTTNKCEKCPSSIQCQDSNLQPLELDSPTITTRPGLLFLLRKFSAYRMLRCFLALHSAAHNFSTNQ